MQSTFEQRNLSIISFALFFAWLLAFPFEGQVFYALVENTEVDAATLSIGVTFAHFLGLLLTGFVIKEQHKARQAMLVTAAICSLGSLVFFFPFSVLWYIAILAISFLAGIYVSCWGFYFKMYTPLQERLKTAADVLIYSNIVMIAVNIVTVHTNAFTGLALAIIVLLAALYVTAKLESQPVNRTTPQISQPVLAPFIFLSAFILIITINSGFMYQVVVPAFAEFEVLASYYWAIPYVAALALLRNIPRRINKSYFFYVAMAMIGLAYVLFMWLNKTAVNYLIIDTLMLGAFGVCDLFWWSILGSFLEHSSNPAKIMGIGLSMNVLGILVGSFIGNRIMILNNSYFITSVLALCVIFLSLLMFPILNNKLLKLLENHVFLVKFIKLKESEQEEALAEFKESAQLTQKEIEVVKLLLRGFTYRAVSENLFISENTVKFHIKNIYRKLGINSKMELIRIFTTTK